jgi:hypothetical protein
LAWIVEADAVRRDFSSVFSPSSAQTKMNAYPSAQAQRGASTQRGGAASESAPPESAEGIVAKKGALRAMREKRPDVSRPTRQAILLPRFAASARAPIKLSRFASQTSRARHLSVTFRLHGAVAPTNP